MTLNQATMYDFAVLRELRKRESLTIAEVSASSGISTAGRAGNNSGSRRRLDPLILEGVLELEYLHDSQPGKQVDNLGYLFSVRLFLRRSGRGLCLGFFGSLWGLRGFGFFSFGR